MGLPIQNYTPQAVIAKQKSRSFKSWLILLCVVAVWVLAIVAAPIAKINAVNGLADWLYSFFGHICHQISARSFHIHEAPFAVCARCFGFYAGFLGGTLIYPLCRPLENTESFPRFWLFAAMIPMGVDFFLTFFGIWENTHLSRVLTGAILGAACAFFIIPAIIELNWVLRSKLKKTPRSV